jgi:hypothetical protein
VEDKKLNVELEESHVGPKNERRSLKRESIFTTVHDPVWYAVAYYLVNRPVIASRIRRIGHMILSSVLIALGIYILAESFV